MTRSLLAWGIPRAALVLALSCVGGCDDASLFSTNDSLSKGEEEGEDNAPDLIDNLIDESPRNPLTPDHSGPAVPDHVVEIGAGNIHVCARISSGELLCWGYNGAGQLGTGSKGGSFPLPGPVVGLSDSVSLQVGEETTCSLDAEGTAKCWGWNHDGPGNNYVLEPTLVADISGVREIIPSRTSVCAVLDTGEVSCWGDNFFGQLGDGTKLDHYAPKLAVGISDAVDASGAEGHFCALHETGEVSCWGWNGSGQLGYDGPDSTTPLKVPGITTAVAIGVGHSHSCAILESGDLWCWGANDSGQLGDGTFEYRSTPMKVLGLSDVTSVVGGYVHTCALTGTGEVYCFGWDGNGNIGDGVNIEDTDWEVSIPSKVLGIDDAVQLTCGSLGDFNCVLRATGEVACWGLGYSGQLGPDVMDYPYGVTYEPVTLTGLPLLPN